jgi:glycosyltransferase involved in cell wall biosynthesis
MDYNPEADHQKSIMKKSQEILVILSPGFAANEADSTCLPAQQQLVLNWQEQFPGIVLVVIAFQYPFSVKPYQWNGTTVIPFNGKNRGGIYRLFLWVRIWKQLRVLQKKYEIIGLLSFWYGEAALLGKRFGKRYGIRYFAWLFGQDARKGNRYTRLLRPKPNELLALSDSLVTEFETNYGTRPMHVIPLGIAPRSFVEKEPERDIDILGIGALIGLKQYDILIKTVAAIQQQFPGIRAVICGSGPEKENLESLITYYGLNDTITLKGEQSHDTVLKLMQRTKILLHPSSYEGFSGACLEALYAGAYVISFVKPMNAPIKHWYTVTTEDEMIVMMRKLLTPGSLHHAPVLPYPITDTTKQIHKLFTC